MTPEPFIREALFHAAAGIANADERKAFLDQVCQGQPTLRKRLETQLELQRAADSLFDLEPDIKPEPTGEGAEEGIGARIGRYRLIERIGEGGCGVVYLAEQQEPVKRKVALKIIRLGMDTENVVARFEAERQALALMDHPNIARVYDAGATGTGRPYFVMELVEGDRITEFCEHAGLPQRERLELFVKVCQAIQHAHQKGIIHRDIKPSNVLVRQHDGAPVPCVIDFGIAKAATGEAGENATITVREQFIGTPAYMSPEQASGGTDIDTRSDIYSLGVLLYEMIAGRPPFEAKRLTQSSLDETRRILREEIPRPPSVAGGSRTKANDLDWIVMKAMAKERERRYETANGFAVDVLRYLDGEPVSARPPSRGYRLAKLVSRNKVAFIGGGIAVCCLLMGFGVSTWLFFREKAAREEQVRLRHEAEQARLSESRSREEAEYREQVAQAAVQIGRNEWEKADGLLAEVPLERTPVSLESASCFRRVAEWHMAERRWEVAAKRYASAAFALSSVDDSDRTVISIDVQAAAAMNCLTGDRKTYDQIRDLALSRFAHTRHPQVAEQVLKASMLAPPGAGELERLKATTAPISGVIEGSIEKESVRFAAWCCFALGLKEFRFGDHARATEWLNRCLKYPDDYAPRKASIQFIFALMEQRNGNEDAAKALIESSRGEVEKAIQGELKATGPQDFTWLDWIVAKVLLDEALEAL